MSQLGFFDMLADAEAAQAKRKLAEATAHLPGSMAEAVPVYRAMIERHHEAMLSADVDAAMAIRNEAHTLAEKLIDGKPGILAGPDAPGCVLAAETAAKRGQVPMWGQEGDLIIEAAGTRVRIKMDGMFGICSLWTWLLGFSAHAVDWDRPFISETGYRSFIGIGGGERPGLTPDGFVREAIERYVDRDRKGKLVPIGAAYRERHAVPAG